MAPVQDLTMMSNAPRRHQCPRAVRLIAACAAAALAGFAWAGSGLAQKPSDGTTTKPAPPTAAPPQSPLQRLMKDGVPDNSIKRARLRDNLYALLATSADEATAKKIGLALQRVWLTSGSDTIDLLMLRAIKAQKGKKDALSMRLFNSVVDLAPDYAEAWNRRAYVHYKRRDYHAAAGDLRRTLALDPKHYKALSGLGTILAESGDDAGALKVYQRLLDINPNAKDAKSTFEELKRKVEGRGI